MSELIQYRKQQLVNERTQLQAEYNQVDERLTEIGIELADIAMGELGLARGQVRRVNQEVSEFLEKVLGINLVKVDISSLHPEEKVALYPEPRNGYVVTMLVAATMEKVPF